MICYHQIAFKFLIASVFSFFFFSCEEAQKEVEHDVADVEHADFHLHAVVQQYRPDFFNAPQHRYMADIGEGIGSLNAGDANWQVIAVSQEVEGVAHAQDYDLFFELKRGDSPASAVMAELGFEDWNPEVFVLLPGCAYKGNKFESRKIRYSPKLLDPRDIGKDVPTIVTDVPRLNKDFGPSKLHDRSGAMTTPSMAIYNPKTQLSTIVLFPQGNYLGDFGIELEENKDKTKAHFRLVSPLVRQKTMYKITNNEAPSTDVPADFHTGDTIRISFRVYEQKCSSIEELYDQFFEVRKALWQADAPTVLPFSAAFAAQEKKFNEQNFVDEWGYYAVGMQENFLQDWQIGWTGGMISTYPLLFKGKQATKDRVMRNFNWLFPDGVAPSGFFWDSGEDGDKWYGGDIRKPHTKDWHLVRKSGDGLYFVLKQLMLMDSLGLEAKPLWKQQTKACADAFVKLWEKEGQLGNFIFNTTGEIAVGGSTSGAIVPAALVLASDYYKEPSYLKTAEAMGQYYYKAFTQKGFTTGGPGDAMQNPDSESAFSLVVSFAELFEATGDEQYKKMAEQATKQFATWVISYNYDFPDSTLFGREDMRSLGAVNANTQNKHGAPHICTHSGLALLKVYRATGNSKYKELLKDIVHGSLQYIGHPKKPIEGVKDGWVCERVSTTDWNEGIGEITYMSTWAETAIMLSIVEVPGLYVEMDKGEVTTFDHIEAKVVKRNADGMVLELKNPTGANAEVTLLAETKEDKAKALGQNRLFAVPVVKLAAGESKTLRLNANGKVIGA